MTKTERQRLAQREARRLARERGHYETHRRRVERMRRAA